MPLATVCRWPSHDERSSASTHINDDHVSIRVVAGRCELSVRARGTISFSDDDGTVDSLGEGSWFEIEEGRGRKRRRAEFTSGDGKTIRRTLIDGRETAWTSETDAWLKSALIVMFRRTGYGAEARVKRLYARGGVRAVLEEARLMHSSSARSRLYADLLSRSDLPAPPLTSWSERARNSLRRPARPGFCSRPSPVARSTSERSPRRSLSRGPSSLRATARRSC